MARYSAEGTRVATNLFEAAAWHRSIKVVCRECGHATTFNAHGLWWKFEKRGWDINFYEARRRFSCIPCRKKTGRRVQPRRLEIVDQSEGDVCLAMPDEREWKRAISRFRS